MEIYRSDRISWRPRAGLIGLTTALLALGGCVTCPDGSMGNACYPTAPGQYGGAYYPTAPAQPGRGYYPTAPAQYGGGYYPPGQQPYPGTYRAPTQAQYTPDYYPSAQPGPVAAAPMPGYPQPAYSGTGADVRPGHEPGVGLSYPLSPNASNIGPSDTRSTIAPTLPEPVVGPGAASREFLITAHNALLAGRTGQAQEAMERAQTRLLDRSTPEFQTDRPSADPAVARISEALHALGAGDRNTALQIIDATIPMIN